MLIRLKSILCRYGYGERVQQDEDFADLILQRVAMLQYGSLLDLVMKSPELQATIPDLNTASKSLSIPCIDEC